MDYYANTAFDTRLPLDIVSEGNFEATKEYYPLDKLGECTEYIACEEVSWPATTVTSLRKKKRRFTTKSQLKREKETHEKFFIKMAGDGPFFSFKLGISALFGFYILLFLLPIQSYEFGGFEGLIKCLKDPSYYYIVIGTYLAYRYFNWRVCRANDSYGVTLNRRTGMVEICNRKGKIRIRPFTDYEAVTRRQRMAAGMGYYGSYMRNKKNRPALFYLQWNITRWRDYLDLYQAIYGHLTATA